MKTSREFLSCKRTMIMRLAITATLVITLIRFEANAASPTPIEAKGDAALKQQIAELQDKVKKLESTLSAHSPRPAASTPPTMSSMPKPAASMGERTVVIASERLNDNPKD